MRVPLQQLDPVFVQPLQSTVCDPFTVQNTLAQNTALRTAGDAHLLIVNGARSVPTMPPGPAQNTPGTSGVTDGNILSLSSLTKTWTWNMAIEKLHDQVP